MGLLNLTLAQLLTVIVPLTGFLVALYFYDRSRRRVLVSTLRFWPTRPAPPVTRRHKKLQQPLSLLLQVLAMLLLLLAIADLRFGVFDARARHHVIVLDASSAMSQTVAGGSTRMDEAKSRALGYLRALPGSDNVLLIRADGLATPATTFTADREVLRQAVNETRAGSTALDLAGALDLARNSLALALDVDPDEPLTGIRAVGEVAYIGPGSLTKPSDGLRGLPSLRFIEVEPETDNLGIRRFAARRMADDPSRWEITLELWNQAAEARQATAEFFFDGRKLGERSVRALPAVAASLDFRIRTDRAGRLEARLNQEDSLDADNHAELDLPGAVRQAIAVATRRPNALQALLAASPNLTPQIVATAAEANANGSIRLIDGSAEPIDRAIFLNPDRDGAPVRLGPAVRDVRVESWNTNHPLGAGLREADVRLSSARILEAEPGDVVIASAAQGPVALARDIGGVRFVVFGFDPLDPSLANRLTAPLLFANAVRWFAPEVFRIAEYRAESPGTVQMDVAPAAREEVEAGAIQGQAPVWVYDEGAVRLFAREPGVVVIRTPYQEARLNLTLPQIADQRWQPPGDVLRGMPPLRSSFSLDGMALWPWLALLALAILAADWFYFGRGTREIAASEATPAAALGLGLSEPIEPEPAREEVLR